MSRRFTWFISLPALVVPLVSCDDGGEAPGLAEPTSICPLPGAGVTVGGVAASTDATPTPLRRLVLMGGGREDDDATLDFVHAAAGGDIVVLRASGSVDSYPRYFLETLAPDPAPATVVTVRTDVPPAGGHEGVTCRVDHAEAIWLAGGNQWDYVGGWPAALQLRLGSSSDRGIAIGGTSAGAMILGEAAFDAELGGIASDDALADPLGAEVSVSYPATAQPELVGTLVDSHFTNRAREGRLLAFLARFVHDRGATRVTGIGIDERSALVIEDGRFRVSSTNGGRVWLYEVPGPVVLEGGSPLDLEDVLRIGLEDGAEGAWPPAFDSGEVERLRVVDGVVSVEG